MIKKHKLLAAVYLLITSFTWAGDSPVLEKIVASIVSDRNVVTAKKEYELSVINRHYHYLQWWFPALTLSNTTAYPYKHDFFDDKVTTNTTSLDFALPLPSGSVFTLGSSYALTRDLLETSTLEHQNWGFTQDVSFSIGVAQSLNPWWVHSRRSPYSRGADIASSLAKNDYTLSVKSALCAGITAYITLRKTERSSALMREAIILYDELLQAYRQLLTDGSISWREYEKIRSEQWDYESDLFELEKERASAQSDLYRLTGELIEKTYDEPLAGPDDPLFDNVFQNIPKETLKTLEESNLNLMKENLRITRLISRQTNAPSLNISWGTLYKLPVTQSGTLDKVWKKENFNDNILNNWSITASIDLSSLLTPANRKDSRRFKAEINAIDALLTTNALERHKEQSMYKLIIEQVQEQITRLTILAENENIRLREDKSLQTRGVITEVEYRQAGFAYQEKQTLLKNLQDDLWLYRFLSSFY